MKRYLRIFIYIILFSILLGCFIYLGKKDYSTHITDAERFSKEYPNIPLNNPFVYVKSYEVLDIINNKTGIILIGFSSNEWMQSYVNILYDVIKENNVSKIYYYDSLEDRSKRTKNYIEIEDKLQDFLKRTDVGNEYLYTPALLFIKDGKIINYDDETSIVPFKSNPTDYWNITNITDFKNKIEIYLGEEDYNV